MGSRVPVIGKAQPGNCCGLFFFFVFVYNIFKESFRFGLKEINNNNEFFLEINNNKILDLNPLVCIYIYIYMYAYIYIVTFFFFENNTRLFVFFFLDNKR